MKFIDNIIENAFKDMESGERVFYPNGAFGKGRLIESKEIEEKIKALRAPSIKLLFYIFIPAMIILGYKLSAILLIPALILFLREYLYYRKLPVHNSKLGFKEASKRGANALPNWYFIMLGVCSISLVAMSLALPIMLNKPFGELLFPILIILSFGLLGFGFSVKMYQMKNNNHES